MTNAQMAACFNEWMRRFIEDPERFEREFTTVNSFLADQHDGKEPSYGEASATYMMLLASEMNVS